MRNYIRASKMKAAALVTAALTAVSFVLVLCMSVPVSEGAVYDRVICVTPGAPHNAPDKYSVSADGGSDGNYLAADNEQVWQTSTRVNIFEHKDPRVGNGSIDASDNLIAPGTSNYYTFTLSNDKKADVRYSLEVKGMADSRYYIPVYVELFDSEGNSMTGGYVDIEQLDAENGGILPESGERVYTLNWKWDFEAGRDSQDTLLGNAACDEEIRCGISINVVAEYVSFPQEESYERAKIPESSPSPESESSDGSSVPETKNKIIATGDDTNIPAIVCCAVICAVLFIGVSVGCYKKFIVFLGLM